MTSEVCILCTCVVIPLEVRPKSVCCVATFGTVMTSEFGVLCVCFWYGADVVNIGVAVSGQGMTSVVICVLCRCFGTIVPSKVCILCSSFWCGADVRGLCIV
jgi:hypothetical protein